MPNPVVLQSHYGMSLLQGRDDWADSSPLTSSDPPNGGRFRFARLGAIVLGMYALPLSLVCTGVIPFRYHYHVLIAMAAAAAVLSWRARHTLASRGLRVDNLRASLKLNGVFLFAGMLSMGILNYFSPIRHLNNAPSLAFDAF